MPIMSGQKRVRDSVRATVAVIRPTMKRTRRENFIGLSLPLLSLPPLLLTGYSIKTLTAAGNETTAEFEWARRRAQRVESVLNAHETSCILFTLQVPSLTPSRGVLSAFQIRRSDGSKFMKSRYHNRERRRRRRKVESRSEDGSRVEVWDSSLHLTCLSLWHSEMISDYCLLQTIFWSIADS